MGAILVNINALHLLGVDIAGDMIPLVNDENGLPGSFRLLGKDRAVKTGADDEIVVHFLLLQ